MSSLTLTHLFSLPRWHSTCANYPSLNCARVEYVRLQKKWVPAAMSRKEIAENIAAGGGNSEDNVAVEKETAKTRASRRTSPRTRKKPSPDVSDPSSELVESGEVVNEESEVSTSSKGSMKTSKRGTREAASATATVGEESAEEKVGRKTNTNKTDEDVEDQGGDSDTSDNEEPRVYLDFEAKKRELDEMLESKKDPIRDYKYSFGFPPLVCCFGSAQRAFVPSGRPARWYLNVLTCNKHARKSTRAPGGCAAAVAIALGRLSGKVAFMGKLGMDIHGEFMLQRLNGHKVQTRSLCFEKKRATSLSRMKISKRGRLKMTCTKPCAEDSLLKSEINIDVLKEAKIFYFSTHSLLDKNMRSVTFEAIKIAKQYKALIFYDVNLPLPLWQSREETKQFIEEAWSIADIIEVTKQEFEFLLGIEPSEELYDSRYKCLQYEHYKREVTKPLWCDNLKVLFVSNGTAMLHYYTKEIDGCRSGAEHPISEAEIPYTREMSATGDGIIAGLLQELVYEYDNNLTDQNFLEDVTQHGIFCGYMHQVAIASLYGREKPLRLICLESY